MNDRENTDNRQLIAFARFCAGLQGHTGALVYRTYCKMPYVVETRYGLVHSPTSHSTGDTHTGVGDF